MTANHLTLDVRDDLRAGGEPLPRILHAVNTLQPGQSLRLLATFEPLPLYSVLGRKGFGHEARRLMAGDWEILFTPQAPTGAQSAEEQKTSEPGPHATEPGGPWPTPKVTLHNRGLEPPQPLMRILDALEQLAHGEVLEAFNDRDPAFLYPELEDRNASIRTKALPDGGVHILIRSGTIQP